MGPTHHTEEPTTALPPRLADSTAYLLARTVRSAARLAQLHFGGESLRLPHYAVLCWVEHLGPCTQRGLAAAMDSDPSDLVTVLRALDDAGLLARHTDPSDRRRNVLTVTEAGRAWLHDRHVLASEYDAALCSATDDDGAELRNQLTAVLSSTP